MIFHAEDYRKELPRDKKLYGWVIVDKYAATVVCVRTYFFPQFLETSRSHSNAWHAQLNGKVNDDSTENMPGITNGHQNYEKCEKKRTGKWKVNQNISKTSNCDWRLGFLQSSVIVFTFRFTFQSPGLPLSKSNYFHYERNPYDLGRRKRLMYI